MPEISEQQLQQLLSGLLGRTNLRDRSVLERHLAVGAASAAVVRDGVISDVHIGTLTLDALTVSGSMQSSNYVASSAGWIIRADGTAEFYELDVIADIAGGTLSIGTSPNWFRVDSSGNIWLGAATFGAAPFSVSNAGALVASSATITGALTAATGSSLPVTYLGTGNSTANITIDTGGWVRSQNYVAGVSGWAIDAAGNVEFNDGTFRGDLVAGSISIGTTNAFNVDSNGNIWSGTAATYLTARDFKVSNAGVVFAPTWWVIDETTGNAEGYVGYSEGLGQLQVVATNSVGSRSLLLEAEANTFVSIAVNGSTEFSVSSSLVSLFEPMRITTDSDNAIDIYDTQAGTTASGATTASYVRFMTAGGEQARGLVGMVADDMELRTINSTAGRIVFRPNNQVYAWLINSDGDWEAAAGNRIIGGSTSTHLGLFEWWVSSSGGAATFNNDIALSTNSPEGVNVRMGSGTANPGNDDDFMLFRKDVNSPVTVGSIDGDGSGGSRFNTTSDERIKWNIRDTEAIEHFDLIPWRTFEQTWRTPRSDKERFVTRHGVVAQEMYKIRPLKMYVKKPKVETDHWGFDYTGLIGMIGGTLRSTRDEVAELRERIDALEAAA